MNVNISSAKWRPIYLDTLRQTSVVADMLSSLVSEYLNRFTNPDSKDHRIVIDYTDIHTTRKCRIDVNPMVCAMRPLRNNAWDIVTHQNKKDFSGFQGPIYF